jgi:hypothetical protein
MKSAPTEQGWQQEDVFAATSGELRWILFSRISPTGRCGYSRRRLGVGERWHVIAAERRQVHLDGHESRADEPFGLMMSSDEQGLTQRLRMHVEQLAGKIGERNVFRPTSLHAAASYIGHEWEQQGYVVTQIGYDVSGVRCLNLETTRAGTVRQHEILVIGAHYDTVAGCPGANDNTSGVSAVLELVSPLRQH